jgi:glycosyltransferase involved in cell wall biosynthesis
MTNIDVDFSLALINRTGAFHISADLIDSLRPMFSAVHCWRLSARPASHEWLRRLLARAMLGEHRILSDLPLLQIPRSAAKTLYTDPLYVLRTRLSADDIVLCHDVGPITHPFLFDKSTVKLYKKTYRKIRAARPGLVFVSEATRREHERLYGDQFRFSRVITLYPRRQVQAAVPEPIAGIHMPFFLAVGGLEHRKNYLRCISAFNESPLLRRHQLVICGPRGNASRAVHAAARGQRGVRVLGVVNDGQLRWLYERAIGFLLPSLLEGFGVPVVEAAERGLVCIASRGGAQEEALGGHGIFVDPEDTRSIEAGLQRLMRLSASERQGYVAKARAHAATLTRERFVGEWRALLEAELSGSALPTDRSVESRHKSAS